MVTKKPRIVIIGAGMAGLTAANKLHTSGSASQLFELCVVEGGTRIGGRINTFEFCGDRVEQGATWIHGVEGSPVYEIAQQENLLHSEQPWECMDGIQQERVTIAEGGHVLNPSLVEPVSTLFKGLMDFIQGEKTIDENGFCSKILKQFNNETEAISVGSFLRKGLEAYWCQKDENGLEKIGKWDKKSLQEAIFAMNESVQRTFTGAGELNNLDYNAESEYVMFPGEELTIAKGYSSIVEHLASVLPVGMIQLNRKVTKIEWQSDEYQLEKANGHDTIRPVKLHFSDGTTMSADHVIVTVSLGVLKHAPNMFNPPLPSSKAQAISRLGYGTVNKVFLQLTNEKNPEKFPFLEMAFHQTSHEQTKTPDWIRKTSFISPIYTNSRTMVSWFTGKEAIKIESLSEEEIIHGFTETISNFLPKLTTFGKALRTKWGTNPLFYGSYSYIAVGSSTNDMDTLAEPLPLLQIMFAGEATHRKHYSTTHGAYFSGIREANRVIKLYSNCV